MYNHKKKKKITLNSILYEQFWPITAKLFESVLFFRRFLQKQTNLNKKCLQKQIFIRANLKHNFQNIFYSSLNFRSQLFLRDYLSFMFKFPPEINIWGKIYVMRRANMFDLNTEESFQNFKHLAGYQIAKQNTN